MSITLKQHNNCCCYGLFEKKKDEFLFDFLQNLLFHTTNTFVELKNAFRGIYLTKYAYIYNFRQKQSLKFSKIKNCSLQLIKITLDFSVYFLTLLLHQQQSTFIYKMYNAWTLIGLKKVSVSPSSFLYETKQSLFYVLHNLHQWTTNQFSSMK